MTEKFDQFMHEVQEDLRQERFEKLWQQYGKTITGVCVGIILIAILYNFWHHEQDKKRDLLSEQFVSAQNLIIQGKYVDAVATMEMISKSSNKNYAILARFNAAAALIKEGTDLSRAISIYEEIFNDSRSEKFFKDLAKVLSVSLRLSMIEETKNVEALTILLNEIASLTLEKSQLRHLAMELQGIIYMQMSKNKEAFEIFKNLAQDKETPPELRIRVQLVNQILSSRPS